jgi:outer membrane receptor protein involved in Fe transport
MRLVKKALPMAVAIFSGAYIAPITYASALEGRGLLEEILVTAQKRKQSVNDVPIAINAFSGDDLKALGVNDTRDLSGLVPSFTMAKSQGNTPIYSLRGVGFNTPNLSASSPVGVYYDEAAHPYPYMSKGLSMDIERVEVLKGPQGTLYGRNTTGGLVNFIANKPTEEFEAGIAFDIGSYDSYGSEVFVSGRLSDTVRARVVARTAQREEGWQKSVSRNDTLGEDDRTAIRAIFEVDITDSLTTTLTANYWEDKSDPQAGQVIAFIPESPILSPGFDSSLVISNPDAKDADWVDPSRFAKGAWPGPAPSHRPDIEGDGEQTSISLRFDQIIGDSLTLTSLTTYIDVERADISDRDGTQFEDVYYLDQGSIESLSQEFRLAGSNEEGTLNYLAGVYLSKDDLIDNGAVWAGDNTALNRLRFELSSAAEADGEPQEAIDSLAGGGRNFENFSETETEIWAIFGQTDLAITDTLTLTAGLRYTEEEKYFSGCTRDLNGDGNIHQLINPFFSGNFGFESTTSCITANTEFTGFVGPEGVKGNLSEESLSGKLGLSWSISDDTLLYSNINRGFKSGSFPGIATSRASQYEPVVQEELIALEVGAKLQLSDSIQLNLSSYYYDYKDKQVFGIVRDPIFSLLPKLVNIPESKVRGAEFDITWSLTEMTVLRFGGAFLDTEITEYVGLNTNGDETDFKGSEFVYAPKFQGNALIAHGFNVSKSLQSWITVDAQHSSKQQGDFEGSDIYAIDAYTVVGLRLSLQSTDGAWSVAAFGRNITDKYYWSSVQTQKDTIVRYAAIPRTWGAEISYNF